jgi:hypothetical protein
MYIHMRNMLWHMFAIMVGQIYLLPLRVTSRDRHNITARVFMQKIQSLTKYIVMQRLFGDIRCKMFLIEWQKREFPHSHIIIWLIERIQPDQIDVIICAEIHDHENDPNLHNIVITNMIHEPCGAINLNHRVWPMASVQTLSRKIHGGNYHWQRWLSAMSASIT